MRTFLGFVIAPAVLPSVAFVHVWITRHGDLGKAMFVATALAVIAYRAALLIGVPTYLVLRRFTRGGVWSYLVGGAALGASAFLLFELLFHKSLVGMDVASSSAAAAAGALSTLWGAGNAVLFRLLVMDRRRPAGTDAGLGGMP